MDTHEIRAIMEGRKLPGTISAQDEEKAVTAILQHTIQIAERHSAQVGRILQIDRTPTSYWFLFGVRLSSALIPHTDVLRDTDNLAFLRGIFAEIFDFLMLVYDGDPAWELSELHRAFGSGITCGPILPLLLPERAQPVMEEAERILDAAHEEEMRRQDQMGY